MNIFRTIFSWLMPLLILGGGVAAFMALGSQPPPPRREAEGNPAVMVETLPVVREPGQIAIDFDGVVVGSPANWWTHLTSWSLHLNQVVQPANSSRFVTPDQWANVIAPEVLKQCDALDGVCCDPPTNVVHAGADSTLL